MHPSSANTSDKAGVEETPAGLRDGLLGVGSPHWPGQLHSPAAPSWLPGLWVPLRGSQCPDWPSPFCILSLSIRAFAGGGPVLLPCPSLTSQLPSHPQISKYTWINLHENFSCKVFLFHLLEVPSSLKITLWVLYLYLYWFVFKFCLFFLSFFSPELILTLDSWVRTCLSVSLSIFYLRSIIAFRISSWNWITQSQQV